MRLAAIDIGSNAARLLISDVVPGTQANPEFIKVLLVRVPLRLGFDVFDKAEISAAKVEKIIKTIKSYKLLLDVYEVKNLKACATSAMLAGRLSGRFSRQEATSRARGSGQLGRCAERGSGGRCAML